MNSGPKLRLGAIARLGGLFVAALTVAVGCQTNTVSPSAATTTKTSTTSTTTTTKTTTTTTATTTTAVKITVPPGRLGVVPTQNREDPAKSQFQLEFQNHTQDRYDIVGVQFVWDGFTSPVTPKDSVIVGGQTLDLPVAFTGATCVGDGTVATMPDPAAALVRVTLSDQSEFDVPVYDTWHVAQNLYLNDCERQFIDSQVAIEWVDLHRADFEGRPVTEGTLRLTRREGTLTIFVQAVSGTIPYTVEPVTSTPGRPWVTLEAGEQTASVPVRFLESRCDPHALAEAKQPFKFVAEVDLGDGQVRPYILVPAADWQVPMRQIADEACVALDKVHFGGD